jgi:hypothetical protein
MALRRALLAVLVLGVLVVALVGALYASDYGVGATITSKGQDGGGPYVVATTKLGGFQVKRNLPAQEWAAVQPGNFVVYHIASGRVELYDHEGGTMLYRS